MVKKAKTLEGFPFDPIRDNIIFVFEDVLARVSNHPGTPRYLKNKTDWGFEYGTYDEATRQARWVRVIAVGPDVEDPGIFPGARILVEPLKWTPAIEYNRDNVFWMTNEKSVAAIDESFHGGN